MTRPGRILTVALISALPSLCLAAANQLTIKAVNKLQFARPNQTVELSAEGLAPLGVKDLAQILVKDAAGTELLCQAADTDGDYLPGFLPLKNRFPPSNSLPAPSPPPISFRPSPISPCAPESKCL